MASRPDGMSASAPAADADTGLVPMFHGAPAAGAADTPIPRGSQSTGSGRSRASRASQGPDVDSGPEPRPRSSMAQELQLFRFQAQTSLFLQPEMSHSYVVEPSHLQ